MSLVGLRLLGPVELVADSGPLAIGGPRQRIVQANRGAIRCSIGWSA